MSQTNYFQPFQLPPPPPHAFTSRIFSKKTHNTFSSSSPCEPSFKTRKISSSPQPHEAVNQQVPQSYYRSVLALHHCRTFNDYVALISNDQSCDPKKFILPLPTNDADKPFYMAFDAIRQRKIRECIEATYNSFMQAYAIFPHGVTSCVGVPPIKFHFFSAFFCKPEEVLRSLSNTVLTSLNLGGNKASAANGYANSIFQTIVSALPPKMEPFSLALPRTGGRSHEIHSFVKSALYGAYCETFFCGSTHNADLYSVVVDSCASSRIKDAFTSHFPGCLTKPLCSPVFHRGVFVSVSRAKAVVSTLRRVAPPFWESVYENLKPRGSATVYLVYSSDDFQFFARNREAQSELRDFIGISYGEMTFSGFKARVPVEFNV